MNRKEYTTAQDRLKRYHQAWDLVQEQAEDEGLWCLTDNIEVGHLQQELRRLHAIIEGEVEFVRELFKPNQGGGER